ncbi:hypothetical protein FB45DRAFT_998100 [Roridomyces roridus]|uniref:Uncharacterized protein n=1 Tax=Roridomyces roridus TaxID=1738132 RepID=A0AAD7CDZ7_9AGAR|nr:hypothetical protein FB45DRAFT_998100 [Roridomyces roridus]
MTHSISRRLALALAILHLTIFLFAAPFALRPPNATLTHSRLSLASWSSQLFYQHRQVDRRSANAKVGVIPWRALTSSFPSSQTCVYPASTADPTSALSRPSASLVAAAYGRSITSGLQTRNKGGSGVEVSELLMDRDVVRVARARSRSGANSGAGGAVPTDPYTKNEEWALEEQSPSSNSLPHHSPRALPFTAVLGSCGNYNFAGENFLLILSGSTRRLVFRSNAELIFGEVRYVRNSSSIDRQLCVLSPSCSQVIFAREVSNSAGSAWLKYE